MVKLEIARPDFEGIIDRAMDDVVGTAAGFEVKRLNTATEINFGEVEITGAMLLPGLNNAMLTISLSHKAAEVLIAYMTGIFPDQLEEEDLYDGAAEIVNQVAGRIKSELAETDYHFVLTPPFTIIGRGHRVIHKSRIESICLDYFAGETLLKVELSFIK